MSINKLPHFNYIQAKSFFPKYAPTVINWGHKLRGKNTRGNPLTWSAEDVIAINKGLTIMYNQLKRCKI